MLFILEEKLRNKNSLPLISHRDLKLLIYSVFNENIDKIESKIQKNEP